MRLIELIIEALEEAKKPLSQGEILELIEKNPKHKKCEEFTRVKVPLSAIARRLTKYSSGWDPVLLKAGPRRFIIRDRSIPLKKSLKEAELHQPLAEFVFNRFNVYCKTINALKVKKRRNNKISIWSNPDIVGLNPVLLNLNTLFQSEVEKLGILSTKVFEFYSFELKLEINKGNFTECYFQAVSNSSWANFGYLVVGDLNRDKDFISNLTRLNNGYGIGVIHLNIDRPLQSEIIVSARQKEIADINFMNFLSDINQDFYDFVVCARKIVSQKTIDLKCFDKVSAHEENKIYCKFGNESAC